MLFHFNIFDSFAFSCLLITHLIIAIYNETPNTPTHFCHQFKIFPVSFSPYPRNALEIGWSPTARLFIPFPFTPLSCVHLTLITALTSPTYTFQLKAIGGGELLKTSFKAHLGEINVTGFLKNQIKLPLPWHFWSNSVAIVLSQ